MNNESVEGSGRGEEGTAGEDRRGGGERTMRRLKRSEGEL